MAINFIKKEDLSHITRTTRQWETTIDRYEIIPKGVLCIELCNDKLTKIKIGNGHLIYEQLPYVSDVNLSDYYTKEETNNLIKDLKAIKIKGEASSLSDLPLHGNEEGDLWFVPKSDPDKHSRYDEYIWYKNKWESFGSSDIDLSEYAKKSYVDEHIQEVQNEITEIIESGYLHKHDNKNILDHTSAVYNVEKDNKLSDLHNYDDTELREKAHTHLNKNILDQTDAVYNRDKDDKLSGLHNYDDTDVKDRISTLEGVAHSHSNQDVLDRTTAAFTKEQALQLLDCKDFEGTDGVHAGRHGFVPAPTVADAGKVLGANGQWVEGGGGGSGDTITEGGGIEITTDSQTGVKTVSVNAGTGLDIDQQTGELYVTATGGDTIAEGSGIDITTDSQTGVKTISVDIGDGLQFNQNSEIEINTGDGLLINQDNELEVNTGNGLSINNNNAIELDKATTTTIGGVIVGDNIDVTDGTISVPIATDSSLGVVNPTDGLSIDNNGELSINTGDGLSINQNNELEVSLGNGLQFDSNDAIEVSVGDGLSINASDEVELDKATSSTLGGVIVGDNIDVNNGTISVPKAASNKLGVVKPTDGLSIDSNGVLTVDTGDGLSIDSTTKEVNVNVGDGLSVDSTNNDINVNTGRALSINSSTKAVDVDIASDNSYGCVKIGEGIDVDQYGIISVDKMAPFRTGNGLELVDESVRLPSAYARVEYVENTVGGGWALINSLVPRNVGTSSDKSHIIARLSKTAYSSSSTITYAFGRWDNYNARVKFAFGYHGTSLPLTVGYVYGRDASWNNVDVNGGRATNYELNDIIDVDLSAAGLKIDNELIHTVSYEGPGSIGLKFGVFRANTSGTPESGGVVDFRGRIYSLKLYDDQVPIFNLVPCVQKSSSIVGFYDSVGDTFYPSVGDNPFETDMSTMDIDVADWVMNVTPATTNTIGGIKVGSGLSATNDGTLSVNMGDGLSIDSTDNDINVNVGDGLSIDGNNDITLDPATANTLGGVKIGEGLDVTQDGTVSLAGGSGGSYYVEGDGIEMTAVSSNIPEGYAAISYIESNGNQWTQLDYTITHDTRVVLDMASYETETTGRAIFGSRQSSNPQFVTWLVGISGSDYIKTTFVYGSNAYDHYYDTTVQKGTRFTLDASVNGLYINNTLIQSITDQGNMPTDKLGLFAVANGDGTYETSKGIGKYRIYSAKIYDGNTLMMDLVPVVYLDYTHSTKVPGLYDLINDDFYPSLTATPFIYKASSIVYPTYEVSTKIGAGLQFDANGAIEVVNSGTEYTAGDGIDIDVNNEISVKIGNHLSFDQTTGDINVDDIIEYHGGAATEVVNAAEFTIDKIRWNVSAIRSNSGSEIWIQLRYFGFYDDTYNRFPVSSGVSTWSDGSTVEYYQNRTIESLIANTERLCAKTWNGVRTFTMTFNLTYDISSDNLKYFRYYTGNDESGRDPVSWTIEVHDKVADTWIQVQSVTGATVPTGRTQWTSYFNLNLPPSDGKKINVLVGDGLFIDSTNNDVNVKIGQALSINNSNEIDVNLGRALSINNNNEIDVDIATATSLGVVKAGSGLNIDEFGNLSTQATPFRIGRALSLDDESVRLPSAYYKAKYVESNGGASVAIPFNVGSYPYAKVVARASITEYQGGYGNYLFGVTRQSAWTGAYALRLGSNQNFGQSIVAKFEYGSDTEQEYIATAFDYGDIIDLETSYQGGLKLNNETIQTVSDTLSGLGTYTWFNIFGYTVSNGYIPDAKARIYSFRIYNSDDTLLRQLVPAVRKTDNVVGFYDMIGSAFYPSEKSEQFTTDMDDLDVDDPDWVLNASIATSNSLGVVKPGTGMTVDDHGALTLDKASASTIGGVKVGNNLSIDSNGVLSANTINYSSGHAIEIVGDLSIDKFRWEITANAGDSMVAFRYFEYSDSDHIAFAIQSGTIEWSDGSTVSYPSGYDETFAGMMENRTKCTVTGWTGTKTLIMTFRLSQSIMLSDIAYFRWETDDYMSGRQPQEFNIYAHDSINDEWILLKEVTDHSLVPSSGNTWSDYIEIEPDIGPGAINVKYGNGLTLNQNNELEVPVASSSTLGIVKIGHGVEIDPYGAIYVDAMVPFAAGVGLELIPGSSSVDALPEGYGKVDYIESNGSAYTIINYVPNRNTKVDGTAMLKASNRDPVVFGCRKGGGNGKQFVLWFNRYSSNQAKVGFVYGTNRWDTSTDANGGRLIPYMTGDQFSFLISVDDDCNINNTFVHNITNNGAPATDLNLGIFALAVTNSSIESDDTIFKGRIYDFKIYENDELVVNLVPAVRLSDEKVGFYDNINDAFYPSLSSSNQFTTDMDSMVIDYQDTTLNTRLGTGLKYSIDNKIETNISSGQGIDISVDNQNGLLVSTKLDRGLKFNLDDEIEIDTGDGLQFDTNNKLTLDLQTVLINGNGVSITQQTSVLPAGYGQLSYIEGTGQQWTQLDYVPVHDSRVVVDCISYETQSTDRALFGCREGTGGRPQFILWAGQKTTGYVTASFVYGSNVWDDDYNTGVAVGERFTVDASYNGVYINGDLFESITDQGNMPAYKVALFTVANGDGTYITDKGMGKYRIYSFKIYEGNDLVVDLVPALSASTGVGLYDVVNDKFYTSLTATPFAYDSSSVVYPSSYQIATKIGSGLQYDSNGAIEAIPAGLTPATSSTLGGVIVGNGLTVTSDGTISTATGKAYIAGEGINMSSSQYEFSAENEQYLFKSQVTCELHGSFNREFQKTTDDTALGIIWNVYDSGTLWSGPLFVGLSADAVKYTTNSTTYSALGTFSYLGKTWYYSSTQMYVSNIDGTDYDGNMVVDTETYASVSDIVQACKSLIDRARVILKVDEISLLPATEDTLGGIKIGEGLSIDENNVVSSTVYEEGQGIIFETSGSTDSFDVKNKQYYFEDEAKCEITGNFGPRAYWRVYTDDPCLAVIFYRSDSTTAPLYIGLTENSVKMYQTWDGNVLGPTGTFAYKGYSWYYTYDYGLYYSSGVDQLGHLQTISGTSSDDEVDVAKHVIDLAELISPGIKTYDVWNTGTGWLNGAYANGTSDTFYTDWYKEYHSDNTEYFELPKGATEVKLTGISTSDTVFGGNDIDLFNDSKHHIGTFIGESQWHELLPGTVYLQYGVKWSENNDRNISSSDIKSVTLEIKVPKNNAITAKLGDGLTFDENDAITLDESIKLIIHCVGTPLT